jgi:hypothetical protein
MPVLETMLHDHHSKLPAGHPMGSVAHLQRLVLAGIVSRLASPRALGTLLQKQHPCVK